MRVQPRGQSPLYWYWYCSTSIQTPPKVSHKFINLSRFFHTSGRHKIFVSFTMALISSDDALKTNAGKLIRINSENRENVKGGKGGKGGLHRPVPMNVVMDVWAFKFSSHHDEATIDISPLNENRNRNHNLRRE